MQSSVDAVKLGSPSAGIRQTIQPFPSVSLAMVMTTGIVYLNGMRRLAATLMWPDVVLFIAFWILLIGRLALAPRGALEELTSFKLALGFSLSWLARVFLPANIQWCVARGSRGQST